MFIMIDFSKHWGPTFFLALIGLAGASVPAQIWIDNPRPTIIVFVILGIICVIGASISLYYDLREAYRKHKRSKTPLLIA